MIWLSMHTQLMRFYIACFSKYGNLHVISLRLNERTLVITTWLFHQVTRTSWDFILHCRSRLYQIQIQIKWPSMGLWIKLLLVSWDRLWVILSQSGIFIFIFSVTLFYLTFYYYYYYMYSFPSAMEITMVHYLLSSQVS